MENSEVRPTTSLPNPVPPSAFHEWAHKHALKLLMVCLLGLTFTIVLYLTLSKDRTLPNTSWSKIAWILSIVNMIVFTGLGFVFGISGMVSPGAA